jgi:hypothetical protein
MRATTDREVVFNNRPNELLLPGGVGRNPADYVLRPGRNEVSAEVWAGALGHRTIHKWISRGWLTGQQHQPVVVARPQTEFPVDPLTGKARPVFRADAETGLVVPTGAPLVRAGAVDRELLERSRRAVQRRAEEREARRFRSATGADPAAAHAALRMEAELEAMAERARADRLARERAEDEARRAREAAEESDRRAALLERELAAATSARKEAAQPAPEAQPVAEAPQIPDAPAQAQDAAPAQGERGRSRRGS